MVPLPDKKDLGYKFFTNTYEKDLSYWAKETREKQVESPRTALYIP